jgi:predicted DNA-binding protein (UPF0251 family)
MPRPIRIRRIFFKPNITYFKPAGVRMINLAETILSFPELEAIRLIDLQEESQEKAAKQMQISQPTLSRLLKSARKKLSDAVINGKAIKIHGGNFKMANIRKKIVMRKRLRAGPTGECICIKCGQIKSHTRGIPCYKEKCPKCGSQMARK